MRKKVLMDTLKSHFSTSCPASSADVIVLMGRGDIKEKPQCTTRVHCGHNLAAAEDIPRTIERSTLAVGAINRYFYHALFLVFEYPVCLFYLAEREAMSDKRRSVNLALLDEMEYLFAVASVYATGLEGKVFAIHIG